MPIMTARQSWPSPRWRSKIANASRAASAGKKMKAVNNRIGQRWEKSKSRQAIEEAARMKTSQRPGAVQWDSVMRLILGDSRAESERCLFRNSVTSGYKRLSTHWLRFLVFGHAGKPPSIGCGGASQRR